MEEVWNGSPMKSRDWGNLPVQELFGLEESVKPRFSVDFICIHFEKFQVCFV